MLDSLRKNLRMIWKVKKGVQISKIEDEMYMVEFEDAKDKKKIHNLPLKSRTRETSQAIGATIGEALDVDVAESGVQWGKCLRVKVSVDVTKRLVWGKKVAIEEDKGK
ncbi:hypothetical protein CFP56_031486 [Quercus suber]|uniref:Uncharacterized protein n=1 Tax=Quercus suber TaxID=58331 RepID=A0AAW0LUU0_QUESU